MGNQGETVGVEQVAEGSRGALEEGKLGWFCVGLWYAIWGASLGDM